MEMKAKMKTNMRTNSKPWFWKPRKGAAPLFWELRSSTWFITFSVCMGVFTDMFLYGVVVPVFPFSLVDRFQVPENEVEHWVSVLLAVYGAAHLVGAPLFGFYADNVQHRTTPLMLGLFAVAGSTLMISFATTLAGLIVGRVLQGFSASVIWVVGLALLADTVGKDTAAQSFGYIGAASSLGTLIGPVIGGAVYQSAGYYTVFGICFAFVGLDILLRLSIIEKKVAQKWAAPANDLEKPVDGKSFEVTDTERHFPKGSTSSIGCDTKSTRSDIEVASIVGSEFSLEQKKGGLRAPAMFKLLKSPRVLAAFFGDFVIATVMVGFDTTLVVYVSDTFHWSAPQAGLSFVPLLFPSFLGPVFGNMVDKYGSRWITAIGLFSMVPPLLLLRTVNKDTPEHIAVLCVLLALVGLGEAMATTGLYTEYSKVCDAMELAEPGSLGAGGGYAQSYGVSEIAWALAGLISPFLAGGIFDSAGWGTLGSSLSVFCILASIPVLLFTDR